MMNNSTSSRRLLVATLALAAAGGTGAAVAHATTSPQDPAAVRPTTTTATTTTVRAAVAPAPITPSKAGPLSAAQATVIAERQGHGRATETEAETDEISGPAYQVKVVRPGGVEVKVVVDANTGRVLRAEVDTEDQGDTADVQDHADAQDS